MATLSLENVAVDWGLHSLVPNHSSLFLPEDLAWADYHQVDENGGVTTVPKPAYVRPLCHAIDRLELLGYTLERCQHIYKDFGSWCDLYHSLPISFLNIVEVLGTIDVRQFPVPIRKRDRREWSRAPGAIFHHFESLPLPIDSAENRDRLHLFFRRLNPYLVLRLLAESPRNKDRRLIWRFSDAVEDGEIHEDEIYRELPDDRRFLLVTEGSTDTAVLRRALENRFADVRDFFHFVDMRSGYPFTGVGSLERFCQGLAKIRIQNNIIVIIDNDTAGCEVYNRLKRLDLPRTMRVTLLPSLPEFSDFNTIGPSGTSRDDINGRAVSIEMFLDHSYKTSREPVVRWTAFNRGSNRYQGELENKEQYFRRFKNAGCRDPSYDISKLDLLWNHVLSVAKEPRSPVFTGFEDLF